jgi:hypothetical protein
VATLKEANLAREQHAESLRAMGAHAVMVDEEPGSGGRKFAVHALFEKEPARAPKELEVKTKGRTVKVPLVARKAERFRPE